MDETLGFFRNYDGSMNDQGFPEGIYLRPGIKPVLTELRKEYHLSITTAATRPYTKKVLEKADLLNFFDGIFTRHDFVQLEAGEEEAGEASPGGYMKQYSILMNYYGIPIEQAPFGLVLGDNDYDVSCDVPHLSTIIVDSLYVPVTILQALIVDFFAHNPMNYEEFGIEVATSTKKHPLTGLESTAMEIHCPAGILEKELVRVA